MRLVLVFLGLFVALEGFTQQGSSQQNAGGLTSASFSAGGLRNEALLTNLYIGNFKGIDLDRTNVVFQGLFSDYLRAFGSRCDAYLPKNKVEIKETYCTQQEYDSDRFGNRGAAKGCVTYGTRGTGIYADPVLYAAKEQLDSVAGPAMIQQAFNTMTGKNADGMSTLLGALKSVGASQTITSDVKALVGMNGCPSPGLKRFQENLALFALGKEPIVLPGAVPPVPSAPRSATPGAPTSNPPSRTAPSPRVPAGQTARPVPSTPGTTPSPTSAATPATSADPATSPAPAAPSLTPEQQRQQRAAQVQQRAQKMAACRQGYEQALKDHEEDVKAHPEMVQELLKQYTACIQAR